MAHSGVTVGAGGGWKFTALLEQVSHQRQLGGPFLLCDCLVLVKESELS